MSSRNEESDLQFLRNVVVGTLRRPKVAFRLALFAVIVICTSTLIKLFSINEIPQLSLEYQQSPYNESKVALLIENRPLSNIVPTITHFMAVIPPEWKFVFLGSEESVAFVNESATMRAQYEIGKLDYKFIPDNKTVVGQEGISQFLTDAWVYETLLAPAEWLLVFQTDSMLCSNSLDSINSWLDYDWVGASWGADKPYGGNGGLSLRRVSSLLKVLHSQSRLPNSELEDHWLTERLGHLVDGHVANGTEELRWAGELIWSDDQPMGYHTGWSGKLLMPGLFGTLEKRQKIFEYCPEMQMPLEMDHYLFFDERFCKTEWQSEWE